MRASSAFCCPGRNPATTEKEMRRPCPGLAFRAVPIAVLSLGLMELAVGDAQQPAIQPNSSYQCSDGMTVTVVRCAKQGGAEYCEFKVEQNGKPAFHGVNLREKVAAGVKSCTTKAANSPGSSSPRTMAEPGKSFTPPYLNEMPSIDFVKQQIQGKDATDTLARQIAVFTKLQLVIQSFQLAGNRYDLLPDEAKINGKYALAAYEQEQGYKKTHTAAEADAFLHLHGHYELMDPALDKEMRSKLFSTAFLQQLATADKTWLQALQAHKEDEKRASEQAQANAGPNGMFVRNDPGTLAARRCMELGGSELECVGKGFWTGLMDMAGIDSDSLSAVSSSKFTGVIMNGHYQSATGPWFDFGSETLSLNGCGQLVPNGHSYTISKQPNQLLITVQSEPSQFVLSMGPDGSLSGPGPVDVKGQIITGYRKIWMQEYRNGIAVAGGGYWTSEPIYAPKTERCTIGKMTQAPPPPPEKNPLIGEITSMMNSVMPQGPAGLRMTGKYGGQGGLELAFGADAVVIDCGAAHVKQPYSVENGANQILVNIKNGAAPFTLALQQNGTLTGSGNAAIAGRVVTGATQNALTYAEKNASCALGTFTPRGGSR